VLMASIPSLKHVLEDSWHYIARFDPILKEGKTSLKGEHVLPGKMHA
jgi:hypothetical protein